MNCIISTWGGGIAHRVDMVSSLGERQQPLLSLLEEEEEDDDEAGFRGGVHP